MKKVDEKDIFLYLGELQDVKMKIWFVTNWIHNADVWGQIDCQPNWWPRKLCIRYQMSKKKELITNRIHGTDQVDDKGSNWIPFLSYMFSIIFIWW